MNKNLLKRFKTHIREFKAFSPLNCVVHRLFPAAYLCTWRNPLYWGSSCWEDRYPAQCHTHQYLRQTHLHYIVACPVWHIMIIIIIKKHSTHLRMCGYVVPILPYTPHTSAGLNTQCTHPGNCAPEKPTTHRTRQVASYFPFTDAVRPGRRESCGLCQCLQSILLNACLPVK